MTPKFTIKDEQEEESDPVESILIANVDSLINYLDCDDVQTSCKRDILEAHEVFIIPIR